MALKIVHLCDVHSSKGEDVPATFAHTLVLDGGTFAVDLCGSCDAERFLPLVAFMDAFGLLTDGQVDPREAVAEDLRQLAIQQQQQPSTRKEKKEKKSATRAAAPAIPAPVVTQTQEDDEPTTDELAAMATESQRRILALLKDARDGMTTEEIAHALNKTAGAVGGHTTALRHAGLVELLARRWYSQENVPQDERERLARQREIVAARDATPRVCIVDGAVLQTSNAWEAHCIAAHGVKPYELLGLTCPIDGEEFSAAQVLGMHGRKEHNCVHTPQLFATAESLGDSLGIIASIRERFAKEASS